MPAGREFYNAPVTDDPDSDSRKQGQWGLCLCLSLPAKQLLICPHIKQIGLCRRRQCRHLVALREKRMRRVALRNASIHYAADAYKVTPFIIF